jgi:hypothetical protein
MAPDLTFVICDPGPFRGEVRPKGLDPFSCFGADNSCKGGEMVLGW